MRFSSSVGGLAVAAALLVGACGSSTTSPSGSGASLRISPSASGSTAVTPGSSATVTGGSSPSSAPTAATINVPSDQLAFPGKLLICSDMQYPPQEFLDDQGNPIGSDVEIGQDIGRRLGLQVQFVNSVFSTIVQALMDGRCDIIISAQPSTATTKKRVDMITYFQAGQSFVVAKGNPQNIKTQEDLCGKSVAAVATTTEVDLLNGTGDHEGEGLSQQCTKAGKAKITVKTLAKDSDALLAIQGGQADAYFVDSPLGGYDVVQHPDAFELSGLTLGVAKEGISVDKTHPELKAAVQSALSKMVNDGTYLQILTKYGIESGNVFAK